jgi:hypothetical protein
MNCGANLPQTDIPPVSTIKCNRCGTALPPGARFCPNCGATVQVHDPLKSPQAARRPDLPPPPPQAQFFATPQRPTAPPIDPTHAPRVTPVPGYVRLEQVERPRGCYLTGLTTLGFFVTGVQVIAFMVLAAAADLMPGFPTWYPALNSFNNLVCLIGFIGLYNWKKWGASVVLITLIAGLLLSLDAILTIYESAIYTDNSVNIILGLVTALSLLIILMVLAGVLPKWKYLE